MRSVVPDPASETVVLAWLATPAGAVTLASVLAGAFAAAIASFLGVVGERLPAGRGLGGRSRCRCGRQLRWWENVPVAGWLHARGRARCCGATIPLRYLLTEAGLAVAWATACAAWLGGAVPGTVAVAAGAGAMAAAARASWQSRTGHDTGPGPLDADGGRCWRLRGQGPVQGRTAR